MISSKISSLILTSLITNPSLLNSAPLYAQTIKTALTTPNNENISNTFVDQNKTIWVTTKDKIFYRLAGASSFQALNASLSTGQEIYSVFVKTNYSSDATFYIYQPSFSTITNPAKVLKISYQKNTPVATVYDLSAKLKTISCMWADDRGILVAGKSSSSDQQILLNNASADLTNLKDDLQPPIIVFDKNRAVTSMFRAQKDSDLKDMIVLATSSVNPNAPTISFSPTDATILSGTDLDGKVFNNTVDTASVLGAGTVFNNIVISHYGSNNKPAYLLTGAANGANNTCYAIDIFLDAQKPIEFTYAKTFNTPGYYGWQTKNMTSISNYIFVIGKNYDSLFYSNFYGFDLGSPGNASFLKEVSNADFLNINEKDFLSKCRDLEKKTTNVFYDMPSSAADDNGNFFISVGNTLMYMGELPAASQNSDKSNTGLVIGLVVGAVALVGIGAGLGWYFYKKPKFSFKSNK